MNTMISNIADFKNRILVESNTLKQFILSQSHNNSLLMTRDDVILHDYQMANSITLNSILSNFIVGLSSGIEKMLNNGDSQVDSYFRIIEEGHRDTLDDSVKMFLEVDDQDGSFYTKSLVYDVTERQVVPGTIAFVNLETIWYGIVLNQLVHNQENDNGNDLGEKNANGNEKYQYEDKFEKITCYDQLKIIDDMNDWVNNPNTYGLNPFQDGNLVELDDQGVKKSNQRYSSFNDFIRKCALESTVNQISINCIIENMFYNTKFYDDGEMNIIKALPNCKYLVCLTNGFYGLQPTKDDSGKFIGFNLYNLGHMIPSILRPDDYDFVQCSFSVIDDKTTMFLVFRTRDDKQKYYYAYFNEDSFDKVYGLTEMNMLSTNNTILDPRSVFKKVESLNKLDTITLAMTDYGFWDIQSNDTNDITYSFNLRKNYGSIGSYNARFDKAIHPQAYLDTDKISEVGKIFRLDSNTYSYKNVSYPKQIHDHNSFVGGSSTQGFAAYDSGNGNNVGIYVKFDSDDNNDRNIFNKRLFSDDDLSNKFLNWLYSEVTKHNGKTQGEFYLDTHMTDILSELNPNLNSVWNNQTYSMTSSNGLFGTNTTMKQLNPLGGNSFVSYCKNLHDFLNTQETSNDIPSWLFANSTLNSNVQAAFNAEYNSNYKNRKVDDVVDVLVSSNKFKLDMFKSYFTNMLTNDLTIGGTGKASSTIQFGTSKKDVANSVKEYLKSKITSISSIGGYDSSKSGNAKYPGIENVLYRKTINLAKPDVQTIFSVQETRQQVTKAIQSMNFNQLNSFDEIKANWNSSDLFKIDKNSNFIGSDKLNVTWSGISNFITSISDDDVLKAFIRTQIYRPLFFKYDDFKTFSSDSNAYECHVDSSYINEERSEVPLKFKANGDVDLVNSGLEDSNRYKNVTYSNVNGVLSYEVHEKKMNIVDDKFVYDGVEYYVTKNGTAMNDDEQYLPTTLYFNTVNEKMASMSSRIQISSDGTFELDGITYKIDENNELVTSHFSEEFGEYQEFEQQIVGNKFKINGVWYLISVESGQKYISFNGIEESELQSISVVWRTGKDGLARQYVKGSNKVAKFDFVFNRDNANEVSIVRYHQSSTINRVKSETCLSDSNGFDGNPIEISDDNGRTFEWYLVNEILRLYSTYPSQSNGFLTMGDGNFYSGWMESDCSVSIRHKEFSGYVTSDCILSRKFDDGHVEERNIGVLYGNSMELAQDKTANCSGISNGIVQVTAGESSKIAIFKDVSRKNTNLNSVLVDLGTWKSNISIKEVGSIESQDENDSIIRIEFDGNEDNPDKVIISSTEDDAFYDVQVIGEAYDKTSRVKKLENDTIHFIGGGTNGDKYRYKFDLNGKKTYRLNFNPMNAHTLDFNTPYTLTSIKNQLWSNLKQMMFNQLVKDVLEDNGTKLPNGNPFVITPKIGLNTFVDMVSMEKMLSDYQLVSGFESDSEPYLSFKSIYQNNIQDISEIDVYSGKIYGKLQSLISTAFGGNSNFIPLADESSINVTRVDENDRFEYDVLFDLKISASKNIIKDNPTSYDKKYILGNMTIKDLNCNVKFVPTFDGNVVKYGSTYSISFNGDHDVECDKIMYDFKDKAKSKSIEKQSRNLNLNAIESLSHSTTNKALSSLTQEDIRGEIQSLFDGKLNSIYRTINNKIDFGEITIFNEFVKNGDGRGIWALNQPIPSGLDIKDKHYGKMVIDGYVYELNEDGTIMTSSRDNWYFDIEKISYKETISDKETMSYKYVAIGGDIATSGYLSGNFTIGKTGDDVYLKVKNTVFNPICEKKTLNFTYKKDGNDINFNHECWLISDKMSSEYQSKNVETSMIGTYLDGTYFTIGLTKAEVDSGTVEKDFTFGVNDSENEFVGLSGTMKVRFVGLDTDDPTISVIESQNAIQFQQMNPPTDSDSSLATRYELNATTKDQMDIQYDDDPSYDEENVGSIYKTIKFTLNAEKKQIVVSIVPASGTSILTSNYLVESDSVSRIFLMSDINGNEVNTNDYGIVDIPINLGEDSAKEGYDKFLFKKIYLKFNINININDGNPEFNGSPGKYCPFSELVVISPDMSPEHENQIYDRYYLTENVEKASHVNITSMLDEEYVWGEWSYVGNSIRSMLLNTQYLGLEQSYVPQEMIEKIEELVFNSLKLDDWYFTMTLTQLKTFFNNIQSEFNQTLNKQEVMSLCKFTYIANVSVNTYTNSNLFSTDSYGYSDCLSLLDGLLFQEFAADFSNVNYGAFASETIYQDILKSDYSSKDLVKAKRDSALVELMSGIDNSLVSGGSSPIFSDSDDYQKVIHLTTLDTGLSGQLQNVYIANDICNLFVKEEDNKTYWYVFDAYGSYLRDKLNYRGKLDVEMVDLVYQIDNSGDFFKFTGRNEHGLTTLKDSFAIKCKDDQSSTLWYLSDCGEYAYSPSSYDIVDIAHEQLGNRTYVVFSNDNHVYEFENIGGMVDTEHRILVTKELASKKIETFHSILIDERNPNVLNQIYLDYSGSENEVTWDTTIYGTLGNGNDIETWNGQTSQNWFAQFKKYNNVIFGDGLFNDTQLRFQNMSKNKDMFDILDVNEIDGNYYGLFKDDSKNDDSLGHYAVFKVDGKSSGNIQRLPYDIAVPKMFMTNDNIYSLYVVVRVPTKFDENGNVQEYELELHDISVPDTDTYVNRNIPIQSLIQKEAFGQSEPTNVADGYGFNVNDVLMSSFKFGNKNTQFFVLSNLGFHGISHKNEFARLSIDTIDEFKNELKKSLYGEMIVQHDIEKHGREDAWYFNVLRSKTNQFASDFNMMNYIPVEFSHTQDVGVIPSGKVDDIDETEDHRNDSIVVSTDIFSNDGLIADASTNPGIITCAVANPATTYDDDNVFTKSQRNPSLVGTEYYDYIYDKDGNALLDLYAVPFIYKVNSNNTYDLYINVPSTRTKYLNRVAGTLLPDLSSQVQKDDSSERRNFQDESLPNNLDESTTKLRVYIDKKFISIGNVEMVEISGNSIPLQIYRDNANDGLYDSIALESRWNGEIVQLDEPSKDINKVMLEFECYGTDSQSIRISGKTLVHYSLDDNKYKIS